MNHFSFIIHFCVCLCCSAEAVSAAVPTALSIIPHQTLQHTALLYMIASNMQWDFPETLIYLEGLDIINLIGGIHWGTMEESCILEDMWVPFKQSYFVGLWIYVTCTKGL